MLFRSDRNYYATALHELGHWTGHESRLNRPLMNEFGTPAYAREELRAEISSMMTTRELGIPHDPNQHAAYVENWIQVLKDDPAEIIHASRDAAKIKDFIMAFEQNVEHEKTPARAGSLNPTGEFKMTAQFDDTGRYLALHSGFQTAFVTCINLKEIRKCLLQALLQRRHIQLCIIRMGNAPIFKGFVPKRFI